LLSAATTTEGEVFLSDVSSLGRHVALLVGEDRIIESLLGLDD